MPYWQNKMYDMEALSAIYSQLGLHIADTVFANIYSTLNHAILKLFKNIKYEFPRNTLSKRSFVVRR